jgi:hypothetical protein
LPKFIETEYKKDLLVKKMPVITNQYIATQWVMPSKYCLHCYILNSDTQVQVLVHLYYHTSLWLCEIKTMVISFPYVTSVATALMKEPNFINIVEMLDYF